MPAKVGQRVTFSPARYMDDFGCQYGLSPWDVLRSSVWWLCRSRGDVRIVLIISVNRTRPGIVIEQWEADRSASHDRYNLRSVARIVPVKTTTITITRQGRQTTVVGAPLVIPFSDVLLRDPKPPRESDFVFEQAYLEHLAEIVWADQNF
jgi:hypothetical protein